MGDDGGDDENMVEFVSGAAGAAIEYPIEAGQLRKNGHMIMKGNQPCKVRAHSNRAACYLVRAVHGSHSYRAHGFPPTSRPPAMRCL